MAKTKPSAGKNRRPTGGRRAGSTGWFGYFLFLLLLLLIWIRTTHKPWWDAGWRRIATTVASTRGQARPPATVTTTAKPAADCGGARRRLSVLDDADGGTLAQQTPEAATIEQLAKLARPAAVSEERSAAERQSYRVEALLLRYRQESDQGIDVVLGAADNPRLTLMGEIPAGRCTANPDRGALYDELREDVALRFGAAGPQFLTLPQAPRVEVTGVGFFDPGPLQEGMAGNGFALRPILDLRVE